MRAISIGLLLAAVTAAFFALLPDEWARGWRPWEGWRRPLHRRLP